MANRVSFLVDGFNVYHSICDTLDRGHTSLKWLDLNAMCRSFQSSFGARATVESVHYFSAYANHLIPRKPDVVNRHRAYVDALKSVGVRVRLSRFKRREAWCRTCRASVERWEGKETDVWIAVSLMRLFPSGRKIAKPPKW